jgi:hypothetical protein
MRVTRHPYEIEGWGVGELWVGDGEVVVAHDPPTPDVRLHGALAQSSPQSTPQTTPRGTPGVPTETLSGQPSPNGDGIAAELLQSIHSYFQGERVSFADVPLDGDWATPFQDALA